MVSLRNQSVTLRPALFSVCVQGRIDAGAHGGKLVGHAEETSELWQNLVRVVYKALEALVTSGDPAAVRTIKDVDILLRRDDLPRARAAAAAVALDYFEVMGVAHAGGQGSRYCRCFGVRESR